MTTGAAGVGCLMFTVMDGAESRVVCGANVEGGAATAAIAAAVEPWPRCWWGFTHRPEKKAEIPGGVPPLLLIDVVQLLVQQLHAVYLL